MEIAKKRLAVRSVGLVALACGVLIAQQPQTPVPASEKNRYVQVSRMQPHLAFALEQHGDRLDRVGKERMTVTGTYTIGGRAPARFQLVKELSDKFRFDDLEANGRRIGSDGNDSWKGAGGAQDKNDSDLVETILSDSMERFLVGQSQGIRTHAVGRGFRLANGRRYDIYKIEESFKDRGSTVSRSKHYFINSDTLLLDRVEYNSNGVRTSVVVDSWLKVNGQAVPQRIRRLEAGVQTLQINIAAAAFSAAANDNAFRPGGN